MNFRFYFFKKRKKEEEAGVGVVIQYSGWFEQEISGSFGSWRCQFSIIHSYSLSLFLPFFFCLVDEKLKQKEKEKEKSDFLFLFLLCFVIWNRKNHLHETTKLVDSHSYAWKTKKGVRFLIFKASRLKLLTPFPFLLFSFTFLAAKQNLQQQFNSVYIYIYMYVCMLIWIEIMFILYKYWYCSTCCMKAAINIIMMLGVIRRRVASGGSSALVN